MKQAAAAAGDDDTRARTFVTRALLAVPLELPILANPAARPFLHDIQTGWARIVQTAVRRTDAFDDEGEFVSVYTVCLADLRTIQQHATGRTGRDEQQCAHRWLAPLRLLIGNALHLARNMGPSEEFFDAIVVDADNYSSKLAMDDKQPPLLPWQIAICQAHIVLKWLDRLDAFMHACTDEQLLQMNFAAPPRQLPEMKEEEVDTGEPPPLLQEEPAAAALLRDLDTILCEGRIHTCLLEDALGRSVICDETGFDAYGEQSSRRRRTECDDVAVTVLANLMAVTTVSFAVAPREASLELAAKQGHACTDEENATAADTCTRTLQAVTLALSRLQVFCSTIVLARRSGLAVATEASLEPARATQLKEGDSEVLRLFVGPNPGDIATAVTRWAEPLERTLASCLDGSRPLPPDTPAFYAAEQPKIVRDLRTYVLDHCAVLGMRVLSPGEAMETRLLTAILLYTLDLIDRQRLPVLPSSGDDYFGTGVVTQIFLAASHPRASEAAGFVTTMSLAVVLLAQASMLLQVQSRSRDRLAAFAASVLAAAETRARPQVQLRQPAVARPVLGDDAVAERLLEVLGEADFEACMAGVRTALRTAGAAQFHLDRDGYIYNLGSFTAFLQAVGRIKQSESEQRPAGDNACAILYGATMLLGAVAASQQRPDTVMDVLAKVTELAADAIGSLEGWATHAANTGAARIMAQPGHTLSQAWTALLPDFADASNTRLQQVYSVIIHVLGTVTEKLMRQPERRIKAREERERAYLLVDTVLAAVVRRVLATVAISEASMSESTLRSAVEVLSASGGGGSFTFFEYRVVDLVSIQADLLGNNLPGFQPFVADDAMPTGCLLPLICNSDAETEGTVSRLYSAVEPVFKACPVGPGDEHEPQLFASWLTAALVEVAIITALQRQPAAAEAAAVSPLSNPRDMLIRAMRLLHSGPTKLPPSRVGLLDEAVAAFVGHTARCQVSCRPFVGPLVDAHMTRQLAEAIGSGAMET